MIAKNRKNYRFLLTSELIGAFFASLLGPFYTLFVNNLAGNAENFGISFGIYGLAISITSYFAGKYSDKYGRKIFLVISSFLLSFTTFSYTLISTVNQLYFLQAIQGILVATYITVSAVFLADITKKSERGRQIGKYNTIVGIFASLAVIIGGFLVSNYGFVLIFYIVALGNLISTILLLWIKD